MVWFNLLGRCFLLNCGCDFIERQGSGCASQKFLLGLQGLVALSFAKQAQHPNAVHGRDAAQEDHPLSKNWIASLLAYARERGVDLNWVNCGLCVDERGVGEAIEGVRRGSPADCWKMAQQSTATLVIPTK